MPLDSHYVILALLLGFAIAHSGLAALRPWGESKIGPRLYRVIFHNDDFTTMEFVVALLMHVFHHSEATAQAMDKAYGVCADAHHDMNLLTGAGSLAELIDFAVGA